MPLAEPGEGEPITTLLLFFVFFLDKRLDHLHLLKRFSALKRQSVMSNSRTATWAAGYHQPAVTAAEIITETQAARRGFKAERRPNAAGENRSERPTSGSNESVCLCFNQRKRSRKEKKKGPVESTRLTDTITQPLKITSLVF